MNKILIITGGSKGIGKGIVETYIEQNYKIFSISRSRINDEKFKKIFQIQQDLSDLDSIELIIKEIFEKIKTTPESITLINNAATLGNIGPLENNNCKNIQQTVNINLIAPLVLTSEFIKHTKNMTCRKLIINISSGAANKAIFGWSLYCSTKAALDMITKTVGLEQSQDNNGIKIISVHPGVVDTQMQTEIRKTNKAAFKDVERFIDLKESGSLVDPGTIGSKIVKLELDNITNGAVIDFRN